LTASRMKSLVGGVALSDIIGEPRFLGLTGNYN
jgi:hypothetical protein